MATGYYSNGHCYLSVGVAAFTELDNSYPVQLASPTTTKTAAQSGLEVISSWTVSPAGVITYSTRNNNTNTAMLANKTIQLYTCDTVAFDAENGGLYDYTEASAMWAFAFITVLMHWFLGKKIGIVLNAIRRF